MLYQEIIWTTLPFRIKDDRLWLSILVSPRLGDTAQKDLKLGDFEDFLKWQDLVPTLAFQVETASGFQFETKPDLTRFDPTLWPNIFTEETYVRSFNFTDMQDRRIRSYPVRQVLGYLQDIYQTLGKIVPPHLPVFSPQSGIDPSLDRLLGDLGGLTGEEYAVVNRGVDNLLAEIKAFEPGTEAITNLTQSKNPRTADFFQTRRFYHRPEEVEPYLEAPDSNVLAPPPPVETPKLDFHQALALLSDHPPLMRRLGIILDLSIPLPEFPPDTQGLIRTTPLPTIAFLLGNSHHNRSPWTRYRFDGERFLPEPGSGSDLQDGYLQLEGVNEVLLEQERPFDLVQIDVDGAAIKAVHFAGSLRRLHERWDPPLTPIDEPEGKGVPSLQTGGLALVRAGRAYRLHHHLSAIALKNAQLPVSDPVFDADELLRGYRVDIFDETEGRWRSLCLWKGDYKFPNSGVGPIPFGEDGTDTDFPDEGYVKSASVTSQEGADPDLYFHEALFRWDGWSLVAPRPGRTIVRRKDEATGVVGEHTDVVRNEAKTEFNIEINPRVRPGSLPRLRFGRRYRTRVRAVDLAGNSLHPEDPDDSKATDPVAYLRYEPLLPPALAARARFAEGESLERMVIRSDFDRTAGEYAVDPEVLVALSGAAHTYSEANERHVVPPKTSQIQAEKHGRFDPFIDAGQFEEAYRIALKEAGTLEDTEIVNPITGIRESLPDPTSVEVITGEAPGGGEPPKHYVIHKEQTLLLPYLPDPIGRGAALRDLPGAEPGGTPGLEMVEDPGLELSVLKVPFNLQWPAALPFRIKLAERPGEMQGDDCQETFDNVSDPPAWDSAVQELTVFLPKAEVARVRYSTYPGEDEAGNADLDILGLWGWIRDSPDSKALALAANTGAHWMISPDRELVLVHAVQRPLCEPRILSLDPQRAIGETFATMVGNFELSIKSTGKVDMEASWDDPVDDLTKKTYKIVSGGGHAFEWTLQPDFSDKLDASAADELRHEFGDTRHRLVRYRLTGTTRFREYFPPAITADPAKITRRGPKFEVHVPASARPQAPEVEYLLPTFRWSEERDGGEGDAWQAIRRVRRGNGLRVYLRRPWFSSGADEKLGAVLWPVPGIMPNDRLQKLVSLIGMDPVHRSNPPQGVLTPDDFSNQVENASWLSLPEVPFNIFRVAAFDVAYNEDRERWYADILFDSERQTSYTPFVRLALARYQPYAISDAHLSPVVLADFMQLVPDRTLRARWIDDQHLYVQVQGYANVNRADNRMEAVIETHDPGIPGELGWKPFWPAGPGSGSFPLLRVPVDTASYLWRWERVLDLPVSRASLPMRLVVREMENYRDDSYDERGERIVYADKVEL